MTLAQLIGRLKRTGPRTDARGPLSEQSIDELRAAFVDITDRLVENDLDESTTDQLQERGVAIWEELCERTDVDQPECPECTARDWWSDGLAYCRGCGWQPGPADAQTLRDVIDAQDAILDADSR